MTSIRASIGRTGGSVALSTVLFLGLAGTASVTPAAVPASPAAVPAASAVVPAAFTAPEPARRCHRAWHSASWFWFDRGGWDRWHHWRGHHERHFRPGWWEFRCW